MESRTEIKYDPSVGKKVVDSDTAPQGIAYKGVSFIDGTVSKQYNSSNGRWELVDERGNAVGFIPRKG